MATWSWKHTNLSSDKPGLHIMVNTNLSVTNVAIYEPLTAPGSQTRLLRIEPASYP